MKTLRGISESSTTSDNTSDFIDIVRKYDVVYNTHHPDYKNVEVKMKVWTQIAEEIGLSVEASKRKWKNLRDSYTKYLRSFRIGTKTSKKYQYWAHADHMEFLKPYQGPGRNSVGNGKTNEDDDNECDLGYQVLTKASTTSSEEDLKIAVTAGPTSVAAASSVSTATTFSAAFTTTTTMSSAAAAVTTNSGPSGTIVLPVPSLPTVQLPPQLSGKAPLTTATSSGTTTATTVVSSVPPTPTTAHIPQQMYSQPQLSSAPSSKSSATIPTPASSTASSVGCLIIEPQLFASADTFKKEFTTTAATVSSQSAVASNVNVFQSITTQSSGTTSTARVNPPLITKIRRVQPSPQTAAINLSFSSAQTSGSATASNSQSQPGPPPAKVRKTFDQNVAAITADFDVTAVLQANRDLDANTLFFLSLARSVRAMPTKFQSLAKMRCMRIVSDIELELDNVSDCNGSMQGENDGNTSVGGASSTASKFCSLDSPPPPPTDGSAVMSNAVTAVNDAATEHFVYVMSPSRVESMIDISSDEENTTSAN